jgi:hypothetical protein
MKIGDEWNGRDVQEDGSLSLSLSLSRPEIPAPTDEIPRKIHRTQLSVQPRIEQDISRIEDGQRL